MTHANRAERLAAALRTVRHLNRLIAQEDDREPLIRGACHSLTDNLGHLNAWIALVDTRERTVTATGHSGFDAGFMGLRQRLLAGRWPEGMGRVLEGDRSSVLSPTDVSFTGEDGQGGAVSGAELTLRIATRGITYGVLSVFVPSSCADDPEERQLLEEVAHNLASALHRIELTEQRIRSEERYRQSEEVMRYIIKHDPNALAVYDRSLRYIAVSDRYLQDYDVDDRDILGKHHYEVFPEMPERWQEVHRRVLAGAIERNDDDCFERPDGSITYNRWECRPWYRGDGAIGGMITCTEVTTERKLAEMALRESEERYRYALEATRDGLWDWDLETDRVRWTARNYELLGYEPDAFPVTFEVWRDLLHPDDVDAALTNVSEKMVHGRPFSDDFRMRRRTGDFVWILGRGKTVEWDASGRPKRVIGTHTDITERKQLEERLRQAEKMEALGRLAGGIAHDSNNQLAGIMGYADLLALSLEDPKLKEYAESIAASAQRSGELNRQLLAYARKAPFRAVSVDLHEIVAEVVGILGRSVDRRIEITTKLGAAPATTSGDPSLLESAILNLAINACDAMSGGGRLTFETRVVPVSGGDGEGPQRPAPGPGRFVRLLVRDTGGGIPEAVRERVFDPFFTTKGVGEGTGMGLAAVRGTVEQHGGTVSFASEVGRGTTFVVDLPLVDADAPPAPESPELVPAPRAAVVLVVDDEADVRRVLGEALTRLGYRVVTRPDGPGGLAYYRDNWRQVDLVMLDLVMPRMHGTEVLRAMQEVNPEVRVVLASGYSVDQAPAELLDAGARAFIQKPFDTAHLSRVVADALEP